MTLASPDAIAITNKDTDRRDMQAIAIAARRFLIPHWRRWHEAWGPPVPTIPSQWTCVRTSLFLTKAFANRGIAATLRSGQPPPQRTGRPEEDCGLLTSRGWMGHAWVEADGMIIDITADQFGEGDIVIVPIETPSYRPGGVTALTLTPTPAGIAAIDEIFPSWRVLMGKGSASVA